MRYWIYIPLVLFLGLLVACGGAVLQRTETLTATPCPCPDATATSFPTLDTQPDPTAAPEPTSTPEPPASGSNQLVNPYFEGLHNSTSMEGWTNSNWDVSIKANNPSPNVTSARLAGPDVHGSAQPGPHYFISQDVVALGTSLRAEIQCVEQNGGTAYVNVYGDGVLVWSWEAVCGGPTQWDEPLNSLSTVIEQAPAVYTFEVEGWWAADNAGVKITNAYFASE